MEAVLDLLFIVEVVELLDKVVLEVLEAVIQIMVQKVLLAAAAVPLAAAEKDLLVEILLPVMVALVEAD
jgi:hypothetical protein